MYDQKSESEKRLILLMFLIEPGVQAGLRFLMHPLPPWQYSHYLGRPSLSSESKVRSLVHRKVMKSGSAKDALPIFPAKLRWGGQAGMLMAGVLEENQMSPQMSQGVSHREDPATFTGRI